MKLSSFDEGAAVVGRGWFLRVWRLRLMWAPTPDPSVMKVIAEEVNTIRMMVTWQPPTVSNVELPASELKDGS